MGKQSSFSLLRRLKKAVNRIKFLVLLRIWQMRPSNISRPSYKQRCFRFNEPKGLKSWFKDDKADRKCNVREFKRTRSCCGWEDDDDDNVDERAEMFIANFRRQLTMERQVSLQLRYCRTDSFEAEY